MKHDLDCTGIKCPMPIVKVGQKINELKVDDELNVKCDDPAFIADIEAWVKATGQELISKADGDIKEVVIRKAK
ncbi:MAG: sulfurtransferase TusA family protein [Planctomycetes bacterium]|nr:sulfurtransferase TusA family protein [Planctomycetota bacterium]